MMMSEEDLYSDYLDDSWMDKPHLSRALSLSLHLDYIGSKVLNSSKRSIYQNQIWGAIRVSRSISQSSKLIISKQKLRQLPEGTYRRN
jgi:hypothetical protein